MTDFGLFFEGLELEVWHWLSVALVLIMVELAFIGAYFLLLTGFAAALVGGALFLLPDLSWQTQVALWAMFSIIAIVGWSFVRKAYPASGRISDEPLLNNRGAQYVGRVLTLEVDLPDEQAVQHKIDDTYWTIQARGDLKQGERVQVVAVESTVLIVAANS